MLGEIMATLEEKAQIADWIDELRKDEGDSIFIPCYPPEFHNRMYVRVCAGWTDYKEVDFQGDNLYKALENAVGEKLFKEYGKCLR